MTKTVFFAAILMLLAQVCAAAETNLALRTFIKDVLLREDDPNKNKEIMEYAQQSGLETQQVARVLESLVTENLDSEELESHRYVLSKMSIDALGKLGDTASLSVLVQASKAKDKNRRIAAVSAYVRLAREDSIPFALDMLADPTHYGAMERYVLYERLAEHVQRAPDATVEAKRKSVRKFMTDSVQTEQDPDAAMKLDQVLLSVSPTYKMSQQRETVAKRFLDAKAPVFRDYFNKVLTELRNVPAPDRTDLSRNQSP
jgi:hypothetical protein